MSTDTAFALGALALVGRGLPDRIRTYLLTISVVDSAGCAPGYRGRLQRPHSLGAARHRDSVPRGHAGDPVARHPLRRGVFRRRGRGLGSVLRIGRDRVVVGLLIGLLINAYPATRSELEQASDAFRLFRGRLRRRSSPSQRGKWCEPRSRRTSGCSSSTTRETLAFVPLFALANAGIVISGSFLAHAYTSPLTLGIDHRLPGGQASRNRGGNLAGHPDQPRPDYSRSAGARWTAWARCRPSASRWPC